MNGFLERCSAPHLYSVGLFKKARVFYFFFHEFATIFEKSLNSIQDYKKNSSIGNLIKVVRIALIELNYYTKW